MFFDCHVCASNPEALVDALAAAGADQLSFHPSAAKDGPALVARIHALGMRPGVALTPDEPASAADALIAAGAKCVTVLTVTPGFGGQKMQETGLDKIRALRAAHPDLDISCDGGVNMETAAMAVAAGANVLVAGTAVFGAADPQAAVSAVRAAGAKGLAVVA